MSSIEKQETDSRQRVYSGTYTRRFSRSSHPKSSAFQWNSSLDDTSNFESDEYSVPTWDSHLSSFSNCPLGRNRFGMRSTPLPPSFYGPSPSPRRSKEPRVGKNSRWHRSSTYEPLSRLSVADPPLNCNMASGNASRERYYSCSRSPSPALEIREPRCEARQRSYSRSRYSESTSPTRDYERQVPQVHYETRKPKSSQSNQRVRFEASKDSRRTTRSVSPVDDRDPPCSGRRTNRGAYMEERAPKSRGHPTYVYRSPRDEYHHYQVREPRIVGTGLSNRLKSARRILQSGNRLSFCA